MSYRGKNISPKHPNTHDSIEILNPIDNEEKDIFHDFPYFTCMAIYSFLTFNLSLCLDISALNFSKCKLK